MATKRKLVRSAVYLFSISIPNLVMIAIVRYAWYAGSYHPTPWYFGPAPTVAAGCALWIVGVVISWKLFDISSKDGA